MDSDYRCFKARTLEKQKKKLNKEENQKQMQNQSQNQNGSQSQDEDQANAGQGHKLNAFSMCLGADWRGNVLKKRGDTLFYWPGQNFHLFHFISVNLGRQYENAARCQVKNTRHMRKCTRIYEKLILKSLIECLLRLSSLSATPAPRIWMWMWIRIWIWIWK